MPVLCAMHLSRNVLLLWFCWPKTFYVTVLSLLGNCFQFISNPYSNQAVNLTFEIRPVLAGKRAVFCTKELVPMSH